MADTDATEEEAPEQAPKKKGLNPLILVGGAVVLALVAGGTAFVLAPSGGEKTETASSEHGGSSGHGSDKKSGHGSDKAGGYGKKKGGHGGSSGETVYVPLEPLIVSLGPEAKARRLKIDLVIEGDSSYEKELTSLIPKFRDVLNTYLRAADARDFESPAAMSRVRAHIARRLRIVAPDESIHGVLVTEFILD